MNVEDARGDDTSRLAEVLPYLRRHARALSGSQRTGDAYAAETLEAILKDRASLDPELSPRLALFRAFHRIWASAGAPTGKAAPGTLQARAERHMARLTPRSREALLLRTIEECSFGDIAAVMDTTEAEAERLVEAADATVLADVEVGTGNVANLDVVRAADTAVVVEERPFADRNYAGDDAARIYEAVRETGTVVRPEAVLRTVIRLVSPEGEDDAAVASDGSERRHGDTDGLPTDPIGRRG